MSELQVLPARTRTAFQQAGVSLRVMAAISESIVGTLGSELALALTAANWTPGAGWENPIVGPGLIKNANGTGTQTPTAPMGIVNGVRYRVVIVVSGLTVGSANYTLGGTTGGSTLSANGTYTDNVVAGSTANIIITPTNTSRFTIDSVSVKTADVTHSIPIGVVGVDGYRLDRFWVTTGTLLTPDGMNYYTFKPWVSRPAVNGGMEKVYLGTPRSTLTLALAAGQPLRMHDEQYLGAQVPKFSTVGVDVVVTGTPASATLLVRPLFQADFSVI